MNGQSGTPPETWIVRIFASADAETVGLAVGEALGQAGIPGKWAERLLSPDELKALHRLLADASELGTQELPKGLDRLYLVVAPHSADVPGAIRGVKGVEAIWPSLPLGSPSSSSVPPCSAIPLDFECFGHLAAAPDGIGARCAWNSAGGTGSDVDVAVIELNFGIPAGASFAAPPVGAGFPPLNLPAGLVAPAGSTIGGDGHGIKTLGVLFGQHDGTGRPLGVAPDSAPHLHAIGSAATSAALIKATITDAADAIEIGGVLLVELYLALPGGTQAPVEIDVGVRDAILTATEAGRIVVEPACNGTATAAGSLGIDLTTLFYTDGSGAFGSVPSGAFIVGASKGDPGPNTRHDESNYGAPVQLFAWGGNVITTSNTSYGRTAFYSGTSSASAIIAGAAASAQGMAKAMGSAPHLPADLLAVLLYGATPNDDPTKPIGSMPDLRRIAKYLGATPNVFIRDNPADTGAPHAGPVAHSPDIFILHSALSEADLRASWGADCPTPDAMPPGLVIPGADNYVHVRLRNDGPVPARDVKVLTFWAKPATLIYPPWNPIGSTVVPEVPAGSDPVVSPAMVWHPAAATACCLLAIAGTDCTASVPTAFSDFSDFVRFVREEKNAAWRNVTVYAPAPTLAIRHLGFASWPFPSSLNGMQFLTMEAMVVGAFDKARVMSIGLILDLPASAHVVIRLPEALDRILFRKRSIASGIHTGGFVYRAVPPGAVRKRGVRIGTAPLPAGGSWPVQVLVNASTAAKNIGRVALVQEYKGEEIGRVSWALSKGPQA